MQIEPKLLNISQAADLLGVSRDTLRRWEKANLISPVRTSGGIRKYSFEDLKTVQLKRRRFYRMKQLFLANRHTAKTVFFTSLFWIMVILALKITCFSSQTTILPPVLTDAPRDLKYSETPNYYSLKPMPKEDLTSLIKRN